MKKLIILFLAISLSLFFIKPAKASVFDKQFDTNIDGLVSNSYQDVLNSYYQQGIRDDIEFKGIISPLSFIFNSQEGSLVLDENYLDYLESNEIENDSNGEVFSFNKEISGQSITANINVDSEGLYKIGLDYWSETETIGNIELSLKINGNEPFFEASGLTLKTMWQTTNEFTVDSYGNDIMPTANQLYKWQKVFLQDASRLYEEGLLFYLKEGINKIEITQLGGYFKLGQIYVENKIKHLSYEEYIGNNLNVNKDYLYRVEAENILYKNDVSIRYTTDRNPTNNPYGLIEAKLNVLDGSTFDTSGQKVTYLIEANESNLYNISLKLKQNKQNTAIFRTLYIDGKIPFEEAKRLFFPSTEWTNYTLGNGNENYLFYLEKGTHEITLEVNSAPYREIYQNINKVMNGVNNIALDIKKLTGNQIDESRDWEITDYLPNLSNDLGQYATLIEQSYKEFKRISQTDKDADISSGLSSAYKWLYELAASPNDVPKNLNKLNGASSSVLQRLGIVLPLVIDSPLTIDALYIHGNDVTLPKANPNFFEGIWYEITRFFASFFTDQGSIKTNDDTLNIWVNRSRQYVNLMQQMADEDFTKKTGIKVNITLMPNEDKLILATSSGTQPDLAMGVAGWRPYDFAIRNSLVDLSQFEGFDDVTKNLKSGAFMQLIYQDGVYGMPETQNFNIMFYRKDILEKLNISVPNTWEEVIDLLPELQRYGMNFYSMLSSTTAFKGFVSTMPFILQNHGELYTLDARETKLDSKEVIDAMTLMTDLFTVYALPLEVGSFYNQFKYGNMPIGIGDFGMYNQLLYAAPEIAGLWDIALLPGIEHEGVIDRSYDGASTSSMMFKNSNKKEEAWAFLQWWMQTDIQANYAQNLMTSFGPEYMWNTANIEAFKLISMNKNHKEIFLQQWDWVLDTVKTPASYMLERELSNAWNRIVYDGVNVRTAMEDAEVIVNKEITRKMIEFGFIDNKGNILKPYLLPTKETIDQWVIGHE